MAALQEYLPGSGSSRSEAADVLEKNPDIRGMVEKIAGHAASYFGWMSVLLDTKQYDEWDPPLRMTITVPYPGGDAWARQYSDFVSWLTGQNDYDVNRLQVLLLSQKMQGSPE
jgi:hypothetical protein